MRMATTVAVIERINVMGENEEHVFLGDCEYCGVGIYSDWEHYEMPDGTLYCSSDCLLEDMDKYHMWGEID